MQQYYYVQRGEQQFGPYLSEALLDYLGQGNVVLSDLVYMEDTQSWVSLEQTPLVQAFFGTPTNAANTTSASPELPAVPKRPVEIAPELNLEMVENTITTAAPTPSAPKPVQEIRAQSVSSEADYDLTFSEGVASIEISPSTSGQLKVEIKAATMEESDSVRIEVQPARAVGLTLEVADSCTVGAQASAVITALDEFGNIDSHCDAELSIKYSGSAMGVGRIQLKSGVGTFTVTNERATVSSFVVAGTGAWSDLTPIDGAVEFTAGPATRFEIVAPQVMNAGVASRIQILAKDRFGNQTRQVESDVKLAIQHFVS